jgi:type VII secretion-associated serine protease mycosin
MTPVGRTFVPAVRAAVHVGIVLVVLAASVLGMASRASATTVRDYQWYVPALQVDKAHTITRGEGVVVAVVDSGVDVSVPDLSGQVLPGKGVAPDAASDGRRDSDLAEGHGTSMAGIIAGRGRSSMQVLGIAPASRILPVSTGARGDGNTAAAGIRWAVDHGADVVNVSLGGGGERVVAEAVAYAQSRDVVVVAGAGNVAETGAAVRGLGALPGVVTVAGTDKQAGAWSGSSTGPEVALAAPSVDVIMPVPTAVNRSGYVVSDGTSVATAIVSGIVALIRSRFPDLDAANVVNRLIRTAKDQGAPGRDPQFGFGTVRPYRALTDQVPAVQANPLGQVQVGATDGSGLAGTGAGTPAETGVRWDRIALVGGLVALLMVVGLVVGLLVLRSRRRVRALSGQPPPYPPPYVAAPPYGHGAPPQTHGQSPPPGARPPGSGH